MTCRELTTFLDDYIDGAIGADEQARFEAHLGECEACVAYLAAYRQTIRLERGAFGHPDDPVPAGVPEELVQAILDARRKREH